jgi:dihydroorotase
MPYDLLIQGGHLVDPATGRDGSFDIGIEGGRIAAVEPSIAAGDAAQVVDAAGMVVTPGLIDLHTHVFRGVGYFGIDADSVAARSGVTTWVDAGSAGAFTFPGLQEYVIDRTAVRVLAFINISYLGLAGLNYDEYCNLATCDVDVLGRAVERYRDVIVGIKTRMGTGKVGNQGLEPLRLARQAADRFGLRLMVHISQAPPPVTEVLELLRPGDVLTHAFTGLSERLVDDAGVVLPAALEARESGVQLDIGHGSGSFSFESAEALTAAGVWPDTISSDLHQVSLPGPNLMDPQAQDVVARVRGDGTPQFTLLTVISKFLHLGMTLSDVVRATTQAPADWLGIGDDAGSLAVGSRADVALLRLAQGEFELYDIHGNRRTAEQLLHHEHTILGGRILDAVPMPAHPPWIRLVDHEPVAPG